MKKVLLFLFLVFASTHFYGQITITSSTATAVPGGVNVNLQTYCATVYTFLEQTHTIVGDQINISACYYVSPLTTVSDMNQNFTIPAPQPEDYTINITVYSSNSMTVCDYNAVTDFTTYRLGTEDFNQIANSIRVFPNPTKGDVQIETNNVNIESVKVYTTLGQLVKTSSTLQNNLSDLENGTYLMILETDNGMVTKRIVVQK